MNKLFLISYKHLTHTHRERETRARAHTHTHTHTHTFGDKGEAGLVSKPIITIHSKDDLPCPSPCSSLWRGSGRVGCPPSPPSPPPGRWWNSEDKGCGGGGDGGPLGPDVLIHLLPLLTRARWNGCGHLINASPASYPLRPGDLCSRSSRCAAGLCEKRLANIDSSWRMEEIKVGRRRRGMSEKERGNNRCTVLSWMIYAV